MRASANIYTLLIAAVLACPSAHAAEAASSKKLGVFFAPSEPLVLKDFTEIVGYFDALRKSQELSDGHVYEGAELASPVVPALDHPDFGYVRAAVRGRNYLEAYKSVSAYLVREIADKPMVSLGHRLEVVKEVYPRYDPGRSQWGRVLAQSITDFLSGRDAHSVLRASHALSLNPVAPGLESYLAALERFTGLKGRRVETGTGLSLLEVKLNEGKAAFIAGRLDETVRLSRDVLVLRPGHPTALSRLGSAFYVKRDFARAVAVWRQARGVETRSAEREALDYMLAEARKTKRAAEEESRRAKKAPAKPSAPDPAALKRLYEKGVRAYARRDWDAAAESFRAMRKLDPASARALKALRRVENERPFSGGPR